MSDDAKRRMIATLENKFNSQKYAYNNVREQTKKQIKQKVPNLTDQQIDDMLKQYDFGESQTQTPPAATGNKKAWEL